MDSKPTTVEELFQKLKEYADVRLDLFKLKSVNKISGFMSSVITIVILTAPFSLSQQNFLPAVCRNKLRWEG